VEREKGKCFLGQHGSDGSPKEGGEVAVWPPSEGWVDEPRGAPRRESKHRGARACPLRHRHRPPPCVRRCSRNTSF
jgi:hypothetical protein